MQAACSSMMPASSSSTPRRRVPRPPIPNKSAARRYSRAFSAQASLLARAKCAATTRQHLLYDKHLPEIRRHLISSLAEGCNIIFTHSVPIARKRYRYAVLAICRLLRHMLFFTHTSSLRDHEPAGVCLGVGKLRRNAVMRFRRR